MIIHISHRNKICFTSEGERFRRMGSSPGMIFIVDLTQASATYMGVDLGGGNLTVAQHELHGPEIGASFQQMGGKRVPKDMRAYFLIQACLLAVFF